MGCGGSKENKDDKNKKPGSAGSTDKNKSGSTGNKPALDPKQVGGGPRIVMTKYKMLMNKEDIMGEGTSSICRKGKNTETNEDVAIKIYKDQKGGGKVKDVTLQKFKRQIQVLNELQEPFKVPNDKSLWSEQLASVKPSRVFMVLTDYSKDAKGEPGQDPTDGVLYVITELAQYSLKDFLAQRREQAKPLSKDSVRNISKAIMVAMAGLHAKGFVHIDMKPENMMMFNGRLKVIDVDGCVRAGTKVSIQDSSISFSPCYCAPEWARFLIQDNESSIVANPALDVWSVGMTLCELVTLDAILKPQYGNFLRNAHSHREAGFLFMEWLSGIRKCPLPKSVERFDPGLLELLTQYLLVCNQPQRKSCAQSLSCPYLKEGGLEEKSKDLETKEPVKREQRDRPEDNTTLAPLYKGTLYKLNTGADAKNKDNWIKRDMWIAHNHSLCYYSVKENKRLVLIDGEKLTNSALKDIGGTPFPHAFEMTTGGSDQDAIKVTLAAETDEEKGQWKEFLSKAGRQDMIVTFKLGDKMAEELQAFRMTVKNRRIKVDDKTKDQFEPLFDKMKLWKLKGEGDMKNPEHWFEREMWIARNGSLVYYSPKDERDLVYYTAADVARAKINDMPDGTGCKPNAFELQLPPVDGVEFSPGEFAANSAADKSKWIEELRKFAS